MSRRGRVLSVGRHPSRLIMVALTLLLVLTGSVQQSLDSYARELISRHVRQSAGRAAPAPINSLPATEPLTQIAPPSPSGAYPPYPLNHTLDGETVFLGGEVANHDFETPAEVVGTPPGNADFSAASADHASQMPNFNFAVGTLTGWTGGAGVTIQTTGGPEAEWARISSGTLVSDAFTPDTDAQSISFDYGLLNASGYNSLYVSVLSGATYGTATNVAILSCANCNQWSTAQVGIGQWAGQSIKLKFERGAGTLGVDQVTKRTVLPGHVTTGTPIRELNGANPYASVNGKLTTAAFTVDAATQQVWISLRGLTAGSDQAYLRVLSGAGYATVTTLTTSFTDDWGSFPFNLAAFSGQSIKLQVDVVTGRVGVDDIEVMRIDAPDWTLVSGTVVPVSDDAGGTALKISGTLTSSVVTLPADVQHVTLRYKTGASGLYWDLLTGPTFSTVVQLGLVTSNGTWSTLRVGVSEYAGQSVQVPAAGPSWARFGRTMPASSKTPCPAGRSSASARPRSAAKPMAPM